MKLSTTFRTPRGFLAPLLAAVGLALAGGAVQASQLAGSTIGKVGIVPSSNRSSPSSTPSPKSSASRTAAPAASKPASAAGKH